VTTAEIDTLFAQVLAAEYDSPGFWAAVSTLRGKGNRAIFERAAAWCLSPDPQKRLRGCDILAQLREPTDQPRGSRSPKYLFRNETLALILRLLDTEKSEPVLSSALAALGHIGDVQGLPAILRYLHHPDADLRFSGAFALGCFANHPDAVQSLLKLTSDVDEDVRDWAVFGLGTQATADSPEIRQALLQCLADTNQEVREEAALGLARRHDFRVLPELRLMLQAPEISARVAEAAAVLLGFERDRTEWEPDDYLRALAALEPASDCHAP
jgi:HEAT repeat protein